MDTDRMLRSTCVDSCGVMFRRCKGKDSTWLPGHLKAELGVILCGHVVRSLQRAAESEQTPI